MNLVIFHVMKLIGLVREGSQCLGIVFPCSIEGSDIVWEVGGLQHCVFSRFLSDKYPVKQSLW